MCLWQGRDVAARLPACAGDSLGDGAGRDCPFAARGHTQISEGFESIARPKGPGASVSSSDDYTSNQDVRGIRDGLPMFLHVL